MITVYAENYTHIPEISVWHTHTHTHTHIYIYTHTHTYIHTYIYMYIHIHTLLLVLTRAYNTNVIMAADLQEIFSNILMAL